MRRNPLCLLVALAAVTSHPLAASGEITAVDVGIRGVLSPNAATALRQALSALEGVEKVEVSKIPVRVEMLTNGQLAAAVLPEPFTALAQKQGAKVLAHDGADGIGESVLSFRREVLRDKAQFVDRFLVAYEQAVNDINSKPEDYRALLVEKGKIPDLIAKTFPVPEIPTASVPSQSSIQRSMNWMMRAGLLSRSLSYDQMVDGTHLPRR